MRDCLGDNVSRTLRTGSCNRNPPSGTGVAQGLAGDGAIARGRGRGKTMAADHVTQRSFAPAPARRDVPAPGRTLPPFWWFLPAVALGLCFWIVVLALVLA